MKRLEPTEAEIAALKEKHGELSVLESKSRMFVIRSPSCGEMDVLLDARAKAQAEKKSTHLAAISFFRTICVWPSDDEVYKFTQENRGQAAIVAQNAVAESQDLEEVSAAKL